MLEDEIPLIETAFGVVFDNRQREQIDLYISLLRDWSDRVRLISRGDRDHIWERHIIDCLAFAPYLKGCDKVMDFGSGSGLPGIPMSILYPHLRIDLLEPTRMKALFLQQVVKDLGLNNTAIVRHRSEEIETNQRYRNQYSHITARAVAALPKLWDLAKPFLSEPGQLITLKGPQADDEFNGVIPSDLQYNIHEVIIPVSQRERSVVVLRHVSRET